jgi:hypothetical protein
MEIEVVILPPVRSFINNLEFNVQLEMYELIGLLRENGHRLSMPDAKPVGRGLWELKLNKGVPYRILYGFYERKAILLLAFKKECAAISWHDFILAKKRFKHYCT